MNVVVENRQISGDARYSVPGVPGTPERRTEASREVPDNLHPAMLETDDGQLMIGVVGHRKTGWN